MTAALYRRLRCVLVLLALLLTAMPSMAQVWPGKTVRIIVPFSAGSTPDIVARLIANGLTEQYPGSTFLVENKPGASGNIGTDMVAKAAPDGSTLGVSIGGPLAINTLLFSQLPYDPAKDIAPIAQLVTQPSALAVNPGLKVNTVGELIALLKANPGKYNFASIGNGSLSHLAMEAVALKAGTKLVHVPYPSLAAGDDSGDPRRRSDRLPAGYRGNAAGVERSSKDSRRLYGQAFTLSAGCPDADGGRHRR